MKLSAKVLKIKCNSCLNFFSLFTDQIFKNQTKYSSFHNLNIETELLLIVESRTLRRSLIWKALVVLLDAGAENEKVEFSDWG